MTSDTIEEAPPLPEVAMNAGLGATYEHILLLKRKRELLQASQIAAEEQLLHRMGQLHDTGKMTEIELAGFYRVYADCAIPGFLKRWEASISVPAGRVQYILRHMKTIDRHAPNMPDGTWQGAWPLGPGDRAPMYGACVVYVLYDAANDPCYVGSTQNLLARLKDHRKDGKPFVRWSAFPCKDREAAYALEEKLLNEHMPYLNKKRFR